MDAVDRYRLDAEDGRLYSGDLFGKVVWQGAFRTAGLTYQKRADGMHALRHFYASVLLAQGVSIKELAEYLGHADPGFTLRTYTDLVQSSHERARVAIDGCSDGLTRQTAWRRPDLGNRPVRGHQNGDEPDRKVRYGQARPGSFSQVT